MHQSRFTDALPERALRMECGNPIIGFLHV
jgi:hypothetical protein